MIKNHTKAMIYMLVSTMAFALMSITVKYLSEVPLFQKVLFRNSVSLLVAFLVIKKSGASIFGKLENQFLLLTRSLFGLAGVVLIFYAISHLTLADSSIFMRLSPVWVTVFAAIFLNEKISKIQLIALFIAFSGAIMVIKPGFNLTLVPALSGLLASICAGSAYTLVSYLKKYERPETIVFYFSFVSVIVTIPIVALDFYRPSLIELLSLFLTGGFAAIGQLSLTNAYRLTRASDVSVYNYTGIIFATFLGFIIWQEVPDIFTIAGALLITTSGWLIYQKGNNKTKS